MSFCLLWLCPSQVLVLLSAPLNERHLKRDWADPKQNLARINQSLHSHIHPVVLWPARLLSQQQPNDFWWTFSFNTELFPSLGRRVVRCKDIEEWRTVLFQFAQTPPFNRTITNCLFTPPALISDLTPLLFYPFQYPSIAETTRTTLSTTTTVIIDPTSSTIVAVRKRNRDCQEAVADTIQVTDSTPAEISRRTATTRTESTSSASSVTCSVRTLNSELCLYCQLVHSCVFNASLSRSFFNIIETRSSCPSTNPCLIPGDGIHLTIDYLL